MAKDCESRRHYTAVMQLFVSSLALQHHFPGKYKDIAGASYERTKHAELRTS